MLFQFKMTLLSYTHRDTFGSKIGPFVLTVLHQYSKVSLYIGGPYFSYRFRFKKPQSYFQMALIAKAQQAIGESS